RTSGGFLPCRRHRRCGPVPRRGRPRRPAGRVGAPGRRASEHAMIWRSSRSSRDGRRRTPRVLRTSQDRVADPPPAPPAVAPPPPPRPPHPRRLAREASRPYRHESVAVPVTAEAREREVRLPCAARTIVARGGVADLAHAGAGRRGTGEAPVVEAQEVVEFDGSVRAARGGDGLAHEVDVSRAVRVVTLRAWQRRTAGRVGLWFRMTGLARFDGTMARSR